MEMESESAGAAAAAGAAAGAEGAVGAVCVALSCIFWRMASRALICAGVSVPRAVRVVAQAAAQATRKRLEICISAVLRETVAGCNRLLALTRRGKEGLPAASEGVVKH